MLGCNGCYSVFYDLKKLVSVVVSIVVYFSIAVWKKIILRKLTNWCKCIALYIILLSYYVVNFRNITKNCTTVQQKDIVDLQLTPPILHAHFTYPVRQVWLNQLEPCSIVVYRISMVILLHIIFLIINIHLWL